MGGFAAIDTFGTARRLTRLRTVVIIHIRQTLGPLKHKIYHSRPSFQPWRCLFSPPFAGGSLTTFLVPGGKAGPYQQIARKCHFGLETRRQGRGTTKLDPLESAFRRKSSRSANFLFGCPTRCQAGA